MNELLTDAANRAMRYLDGLSERPVAPSESALRGLAAFDTPLPQRASDGRATLRLLDEAGSPASMAMAGPRFFGFVIGDAAETARVIEGVQAEGTCWAGITLWQGRTAMRISVSSWATTESDVDRSVEAMVRVARGVK